MLSGQVVRDINQHLHDGNIAAALAPLETAIDVRRNELPTLEKATLAALAEYLHDDVAKAQALVEAAFHPNISVRRFAKKLVHSLKADAAPLARPLRAHLEKYLAETIALDYTFNPQEAALRREQADVLNTAVDLLRRCDPREFMECLSELVVYWYQLQKAEELKAAEEDENSDEALDQNDCSYLETFERRTQEIFQEQYSHLGLTYEELTLISPRLTRDLEQAVESDPEVQALEQEEDNAFEDDTFFETGAPMTLRDERYTAQAAFSTALRKLLESISPFDEKKNSEIRYLWLWMSGDADDEGVPKAAAAIRGLKRGDAESDSMLEALAAQIQSSLTRCESSPLASRGHRADTDIDSEDNDPHRKARLAAHVHPTVAEKLDALREPPVVVLYSDLEPEPLSRSELIRCWETTPEWKAQREEFQTQVLPLLWQLLDERKTTFLNAKKPVTPTSTPVSGTSEAAAISLTERERRALQRVRRSQQQGKIQEEIRDISWALVELGSHDVYTNILNTFEGKGLQELQNEFLEEMIGEIGEASTVAPELISFLHDAYARWQRNRIHRRKREVDDEWQQQWFHHNYAVALYKTRTPEAIAEARAIIKQIPSQGPEIADLAYQKRDYEMILPLVHQAVRDSSLQALWDELCENKPEQVQEFVREFLILLAETSEQEKARLVLSMLEHVKTQSELFLPHGNLLAQCLESTSPAVNRFALGRLGETVNADRDRAPLCQYASEKLWSENAGLAKDAAKFLGTFGARHADAAPVAWSTLCGALTLNNLPLLEVVLRSLAQIHAKLKLDLDGAARERIEQLQTEYSLRLGRLCERLLSVRGQSHSCHH